MNTVAIKMEFNVQAAMAAGVAFQTHQVVAVFQMRKAKKESQKSFPFSPCAIRSSSKNSGTIAINMNGAMPHVGHAAVSKPPLINANSILRPLPSRVLCLFFFAILPLFPRKSTKNVGSDDGSFWDFAEKSRYITEKHYFCKKYYRMKNCYKVAGHKFAIVLPDGEQVTDDLKPYEPFLMECDDDDCLFSVELKEEWPDTSDKEKITMSCEGLLFLRFDFYEWQGKWLVEVAPTYEAPVACSFITDKAFKKAVFQTAISLRFALDITAKFMFAMSTACLNTIRVHSSVTVKDGKGYLFFGKSGTGKSTHSQLWINNIEGCELLNDDNPVLRVEDNGEVRVYGSPWSGKTPCYRNLDFPAGAIVDLHQAKENRIRTLSIVEAYAVLYVSFSGFRFIKEAADGFFATCEKILGKVPCYSLDCLPNAEAAWLCYKTVSQ